MTSEQSAALVNDPEGGLPRLLEIMRRLRDPQTGCPWDIEQTWDSIAPYTIEEAYEVADAIARRAWDEVQAELGDLLLQVIYFSQIATEEQRFDFDAVANAISDKMVDRHPHVFGTENRDKSAEQQTIDWEVQKERERAAKGETRVLDGVALGLPALMRAQKLQKRAARVGFDWPEITQVLDKIQEEAEELAAEQGGDMDRLEDEFGDLLFVVVNLGRHLGLDAETALRRANGKFTRRFNYVEDETKASGKALTDSTLEEMDALWTAAKHAERARSS